MFLTGWGKRRASALAILLAFLLAAAAPAGAHVPGYAPYVDMTLYDDPALPAVQHGTGAKLLSLGFVVATGSACEASWGGTTPLSSGLIRREVGAVRAAGGDVIVSFGGAAGPALSQVCSTSAQLAGAYLSAIRTYRAHKLDFDIEGAALDDPAGSARAILAIGRLEAWARARHWPLQVSLTVPVDPSGLEADVLRLLSIARSHGIRIGVVNVMAMDYGDGLAPPGRGTMGTYAIEAATATERQVARILPHAGWSSIGVTALIGVNDVRNEVFTLADAGALAAFSRSHGLARLAMWSVARDRACPTLMRTAQDTCSGVPQAPYAFSHLFDLG